MNIRRAKAHDAPMLAAIAHAAKAAWGYSAPQIEQWSADLSPSPHSIADDPTWIAEVEGAVAGFYQLRLNGTSAELEHLWIAPAHMRRGIGTQLLAHAGGIAAMAGSRELLVDADPNAEAFYLARGAVRVGVVPAPLEGEMERLRPLLVLVLGAADGR